jgi:hypothetical protein
LSYGSGRLAKALNKAMKARRSLAIGAVGAQGAGRVAVTPDWRKATSPEFIFADRGFGFRARRVVAPQNDGYQNSEASLSSPMT